MSPNSESKAASVPGPRSLNLRIIQIQEIKIDASFFPFLLQVYVHAPLWAFVFSAVCLVHIIRNHLLIPSASFVVSIMNGLEALAQANAHIGSITIHSESFHKCCKFKI